MNEFIEKLRRHAGLTVSVHLDFICSFVPPNLEEKQWERIMSTLSSAS